MEVLDRYLQAVKKHLPRGQQDDIIKELSENLRSQMEDREAQLGQPLDEAEQMAILERHGDPLLVASRYRSDHRRLVFGRQLIGPELFPLYLNVLWLSLGFTVVVAAAIARSMGASFPVVGLLLPLAVEFAIVTLVFALLDAGQRKSFLPARLLDRYLQAVRSYLPRDQQDDITKELSENLRSQMEDKEAELGRPLAEIEQEAILTGHGHPLVVAGRYRSGQRSLTFGRQLIGPVLFPIYLRILLLNLAVTLVVCAGAALAFARGHSIVELASGLVFAPFLQFGIVTLIFALVEGSAITAPGSWNQGKRSSFRPAAEERCVPRLESILQLVVLFVFVAILRDLRASAHGLFAPTPFRLAPIWHQAYLAIVGLAVAQMAQAGINLWRPVWTRFRPGGARRVRRRLAGRRERPARGRELQSCSRPPPRRRPFLSPKRPTRSSDEGDQAASAA